MMRKTEAPVFLLVVSLAVCIATNNATFAYTDEDVRAIFEMLDGDGDGKITRAEYTFKKVMVIYRNVPIGNKGTSGESLSFSDTNVSRQFFDAADLDHDGLLSPIEVVDALPFESVDTESKNYFVLEDLRRFMTKIGR